MTVEEVTRLVLGSFWFYLAIVIFLVALLARKELRERISSIKKIGPIVFSDNKQGKSDIPKLTQKLKKKGFKDIGDIEKYIDVTGNEIESWKSNLSEHKNTIIQLLEVAKFYKSSYLDYFFVPNTKLALRWFAAHPNTTEKEFLEKFNVPFMQDSDQQKRIILFVLKDNGVILQEVDKIHISEFGESYLQHLNESNQISD